MNGYYQLDVTAELAGIKDPNPINTIAICRAIINNPKPTYISRVDENGRAVLAPCSVNCTLSDHEADLRACNFPRFGYSTSILIDSCEGIFSSLTYENE